jgi:hypothetical protein
MKGRFTAVIPTITAVFRVHELQRAADEAEAAQDRVEDPLAPEHDHPARRAHGVPHEQRQDHQHDEEALPARPRPREPVGEGEAGHEAQDHADAGDPQGTEEHGDVERVGEELDVVLGRQRLDHELPGDEPVQDRPEPLDGIALRWEGDDGVPEEREPGDQHERQEDVAERQAGGRPEREAARPAGAAGRGRHPAPSRFV